MAAIQVGKYKRPGIFFEEFDQSIIPNPVVPGLNIPPTLVVGFSKKGPINTPVLISNLSDLEAIYGPLDRNLERKGSYFHRTVAKMLESGTVLAMNLLTTNDELDKIEYRSLSTSSDKSNSAVDVIPFRKVHDTSSFWKQDSKVFIDTVVDEVNGSDRLFHITNLSNRYVSVFIFKSKLTGYNQPLLQFYGTADKVPAFVNQLDFASDYLVDVLIAGGDWSKYEELAVDAQWSAYFDATGLRKTAVSAFAQDRNVNTLGFYEGLSLIPFFRDENGRNIFIESVINLDTAKTGVFCAFNADKLEGEFPNGMVDIVGNNLAVNNQISDIEKDSIEFLSYQETITEQNDFANVYLDDAGGSTGQNIVAFGTNLATARSGEWQSTARTAHHSEGIIKGIIFGNTSSVGSLVGGFTNSTATVVTFQAGTVSLGGNIEQPYFVSQGTKVLVDGGISSPTIYTFSIAASDYATISGTQTFYSAFYLDPATGDLKKEQGTLVDTKPSVATNDVVMGYVTYNLSVAGTLHNQSYSPVGVTGSTDFNTGFSDLAPGADFTVTDLGSGVISVTFVGTGITDVTNNYEVHRRIALFNFLVAMLDSSNIGKMAMLADVSTGQKISLENASISDIVTVSTSPKSFKLDLGTGTTPTAIAAGNLVFYKLDNEFVSGILEFSTTTSVATTTKGVAGKYSDVYLAFYGGTINTGDYFYGDYTVTDSRVVFTSDYAGTPVIVFTASQGWITSGTESFIIPTSVDNYKTFTLVSTATGSNIVDPSTGGSFSNAVSAYVLNKSTTFEDLSSVTRIWDASVRGYISGYTDLVTKDLTVEFYDSTLTSTQSSNFNGSMNLISDLTDLKETIEIVEPVGYSIVKNKILVLGDRYPTLKTGEFLLADVNEDLDVLPTGAVGRRLTRILNKKAWSVDPTYAEITCDASIKKFAIGTGKQTVKYTTLDSYASTYKALVLKGFRPRAASQPDGTEETQASILNIIAKGTQLFKALVNKDAIDFRYVVDSFGLGLTEFSKQQIMDICGDRLDCFGFLNMPSTRQFRNSVSPSFLDANGNLSTALIASGGDPEKNPIFLYSFGTGKGTTSTGYFLPYLTINDNGRPTELPPSMFAATTYMRKFLQLTTQILPWTIAAGVTNGKVLGIQGVETNFSFQDLENLNLAQMNPIVFKRNRGFVIETENTAQTIYKSALSYIHVREVLIELERELGDMLLDFQWKFNTPDVRAEIKLKADVICESYVARQGLYNYFNKCDEENNTPDLVDRQIGVIDTYVEPIKGMGVIVNNITILRTGAIEAGGFA